MHLTQCKQCVLVPQVSKLECGITSASWSQIKKKKKRKKKETEGEGRREEDHIMLKSLSVENILS